MDRSFTEPSAGLGVLDAPDLVSLLTARASEAPHKVAYSFLPKGGPDQVSLTYRELDRNARALAAELLERGEAGDRILLLYPPGLDFISGFFGCLYAGMIGIPAYPPANNARSASRISGMAEDAGASVILTTQKVVETRGELFRKTAGLKSLRLIATDLVQDRPGTDPVVPDPEDLAYLQYTSGSTSSPKGVMVSHRNIMVNLRLLDDVWECSKGTAFAGWLPHFHDFGLVYAILAPMYAGIPSVLLSPTVFVQSPVTWLSAISQSRATHTGAPNFAFDLCCDQIPPERRAELDLSCLRVAANGAEPVRSDTVRRFQETFASQGLRPGVVIPAYGLAESTLVASSSKPGDPVVSNWFSIREMEAGRIVAMPAGSEDARVLFENGRAIAETTILIVDRETRQPLPEGRTGEIWISNQAICQGYWQRPADSEETFRAKLADGSGSFLRTGDLGFYFNGGLYINGRCKDLIIIRGSNHYPQDIELTAETSTDELRPGRTAAFSVEVNGEERLILACEVKRHSSSMDAQQVIEAVRRSVAEEHELEVYSVILVKSGGVAVTSSGKIMRQACKKSWLAGELEVVAESSLADRTSRSRNLLVPRDEFQQKLADIWAEVLHIQQVGIDEDFFDLGGNSMSALRLAGLIEERLGLPFPISDLVQAHTILSQAKILRERSSTPQEHSLVVLQAEGKKTPFFCVHPGGGTAMCLYQLARKTGLDRPFYGLQARGLDGKSKPLSRLEEMAAYYIREMKKVQPKGPYLIGGMCLGGLVAYEMGQQLMRDGDAVLLNAVLDTQRPPGYHRKFKAARFFRQWVRAVSFRSQERFLKKVWLANEKARKRYQPKPYNGKITLFWSDESFETGLDERVELWRKLVPGGVELVRIPGNHQSILMDPYVSDVGKILAGALDAAESGT